MSDSASAKGGLAFAGIAIALMGFVGGLAIASDHAHDSEHAPMFTLYGPIAPHACIISIHPQEHARCALN
jgi:hypothetical protein